MIKMTVDEFESESDLNYGRCLACDFAQDSCEPDARNYECDDCGETAVYGLQELLMMGEIEFVD